MVYPHEGPERHQQAQKNETVAGRSADWEKLQGELQQWGRKLDDLRRQSNNVGEATLAELESRYRILAREAEEVQHNTEAEIKKARDEIERLNAELEKQSQSVMDSTMKAARENSESARELAREARERSGEVASQMSQSAQQIGSGFARAWNELRKGFQRAANGNT